MGEAWEPQALWAWWNEKLDNILVSANSNTYVSGTDLLCVMWEGGVAAL